MILYLHGFRSSPHSFKAQMLAAALAREGLASRWQCPQLPASPAAAMRLIQDLAQGSAAGGDTADFVVIGSSLGGFYATWLREQIACRAAVLNPVVHAARDLATQVGAQQGFHDGRPFEFTAAHVAELAAAEAQIPVLADPGRYFLMAATGDEVLDWREMQARYAGARQRIIPGSDHGLSDFARWMPELLDFILGRAAPADAESEPPAADASAIEVSVGAWDAVRAEASRIRAEVFVQEQHVPAELELDALDPACAHALARTADGQAIGTARLLPDGHVGRMAVRKAWRGRGVGSRLLEALVAEAARQGHAEVVLAAQCHAQAFYAAHGFVAQGDVFMDAGIAHVTMRRALG